MTDAMHRPEGTGPKQLGPTAQASTTGQSRMGPMGYGGGPLLAAGVMVGGVVLFAGWGVLQMANADDGGIGAQQDKPVVSAPEVPGDRPGTAMPNEDGTVTVTLPDLDGNGIADAFEDKSKDLGTGEHDSRIDLGDASESAMTVNEPSPKAEVYLIEPGDTLSGISGETGVPIDLLVEANGIQNPNLIFAGASLLIPPV